MELEELIEKVVDIKKMLIELEDMFRECDGLDGEAFLDCFNYKRCVYEDLTCIKSILVEEDWKNRNFEEE